MWNEPWVWPEVGDARMSGAGTVPLRLAQMMGQQKKKKKKKKKATKLLRFCFLKRRKENIKADTGEVLVI